MELAEGQRATLEAIARSKTAAHQEVLRAQVLLLAGEGVANSLIADQVGVSAVTVRAWRARFGQDGLSKFAEVRPGRGRKHEIPQETIDEIVRLTQDAKPEGETHWSCRSMAKATGVSAATVQRVACPGAHASPGGDLQAVGRPPFRGKAGGRGRPLPRPAGQSGCPLPRREVPCATRR